MNADRVDVLHVADGDRGVVGVPHHFILDLFVSLDALLDKNLMHGRKREGILHDLPALFFLFRKTAAGSAQGKRRPEHHGITDLFRRLHALLETLGNHGREYGLSQLHAQFLEQFSVFRTLDTLYLRTQKLHAAFVQDALFLQLHRKV